MDRHRDALRVERAELRTAVARSIADHLASVLGAPVSIESGTGSLTDVSTSFGAVALHRMSVSGAARIQVAPPAKSAIAWLLDGEGDVSQLGVTRDLAAGDVVLLPAGPVPLTACVAGATLVVVSIDPAVRGERFGAAVPPHLGGTGVRFTRTAPASPDLARAWQETVGFVERTVLGLAEPSPLVLGVAERLLVATALTVFPHDVDRDVHPDGIRSALPPVLGQAMQFVERNAHRDIGVDEIAAAVFVTPRRVQALFKEHLATTPTGYLRDVRLRRAHQDLLHSERTSTTVGAVAARWRFAHTGRFAVTYRGVFGESPHETLRRYP